MVVSTGPTQGGMSPPAAAITTRDISHSVDSLLIELDVDTDLAGLETEDE